jgi:cell division protein FtsB
VAKKAKPSSPARIRWDRLGRYALILIFIGIAYLYISPLQSWIGAYGESNKRGKELAALKAKNKQLEARAKALTTPGAIELEARDMGMIQDGERAYFLTEGRKR